MITVSESTPLFVLCPAKLSPSPGAPESEKLACVLTYGHLDPRDHQTAEGEVFSFDAGIEAVRPAPSTPATPTEPMPPTPLEPVVIVEEQGSVQPTDAPVEPTNPVQTEPTVV